MTLYVMFVIGYFFLTWVLSKLGNNCFFCINLSDVFLILTRLRYIYIPDYEAANIIISDPNGSEVRRVTLKNNVKLFYLW